VTAGPEPRFFFDNNLSHHLVAGMLAFGENVEHLRDNFIPDAGDHVWMPYVGTNRLTLITSDARIWRNPTEIALIHRYRIGGFVIPAKNADRCTIIQQLVRHWPMMKVAARTEEPPFLFQLKPTGTKLVSLLSRVRKGKA
jgi:hypothetical protein